MTTAALPRVRKNRPQPVLTGRLIFSVYMLPASLSPSAAAVSDREPVLVCESYDDAQAHFRRWLRENLKRPSGFYPLIVVDEEGGAV